MEKAKNMQIDKKIDTEKVIDLSNIDPMELEGEINRLFGTEATLNFENADVDSIYERTREMIASDSDVQEYIFTPADMDVANKIIEGEITANKNSGVYNMRINALMNDKQKTDAYVASASEQLYKKIKNAIINKLGADGKMH